MTVAGDADAPLGRVLLTGEHGFLGGRTRVALDGGDREVEIHVLGKRLSELGLQDRLAVDGVIHLAAWTSKRPGASDLDAVVESNAVGLQALLRSLDPPPQRFLFASTADVYAVSADADLVEGSQLQPSNAYAASKILGEQMVAEDARARGYAACNVRIGHLYGPGEGAYEKFVPITIRALMSGRPPTVVGDGSTRRDLLFVDDAAEALRRLLFIDGDLPSIVNLASAVSYSLEQIARTLIETFGFIGGIRYLRDHASPPSITFDTTLLSETIGEDWERVQLAEGLRREVDYVVEQERGSPRPAQEP